MSEVLDRDRRLIDETVKKTRNYYLFHAFVELAIFIYIALDLRPLSTGFGVFQVAILALTALLTFLNLRTWFRARPRGPVARALLDQPTELTSVQGWPGVKFPDGRWPLHLKLQTTGGAKGTLRVDESRMKPLIAALHRRAPSTWITVQNVTPGPVIADAPVSPAARQSSGFLAQ